jgi:hypothetical protein
MTPTLSESPIVWNLAEAICQRVSRKTIRALQKMTEGMQSGDDSVLVNVWEEICVQVQGEESVLWDAYDVTVKQMLSGELAKLPVYECEAVWLQTLEGQDWDAEDEDARSGYPVAEDDIIEYVKRKYVYSAAADWSNRRIREYLEHSYWAL